MYRTPPNDVTCCTACGAAVFSTADHDAWHARVDPVRELVVNGMKLTYRDGKFSLEKATELPDSEG